MTKPSPIASFGMSLTWAIFSLKKSGGRGWLTIPIGFPDRRLSGAVDGERAGDGRRPHPDWLLSWRSGNVRLAQA
jgi:hypothetical protein